LKFKVLNYLLEPPPVLLEETDKDVLVDIEELVRRELFEVAGDCEFRL